MLYKNNFVLTVIEALKYFVCTVSSRHNTQFLTWRLSVGQITCNSKFLMHGAGHITVLEPVCEELPTISDGLSSVCDNVCYCYILLLTLLFILLLIKWVEGRGSIPGREWISFLATLANQVCSLHSLLSNWYLGDMPEHKLTTDRPTVVLCS
jgi:hypothetical protein